MEVRNKLRFSRLFPNLTVCLIVEVDNLLDICSVHNMMCFYVQVSYFLCTFNHSNHSQTYHRLSKGEQERNHISSISMK